MMVVMTSLAPVRARSQPISQPQAAPPTNPPASAATTWMKGGSCTPKPIQPATKVPPMNWPAAPILNRPARNGIITARPASINGVERTSVSEMGANTAVTEPPWNARETVWGSTIEPRNIAVYAPLEVRHAAEMAPPGAEKKSPHLFKTCGSVNEISRPPSTMAATKASNVTATVPPWTNSSMRIAANDCFPGPPDGSPGPGAGDAGWSSASSVKNAPLL